MGGAFRASESLVIRLETERITITGANDRQQIFVPDGEVHEEESRRGTVTTQTEWKHDELVIRRERAEGRTITRTYKLDKAGNRLTVRTKISGGGRPGFDFKHVYDRAPASQPEESEPTDSE